MPVKVSMSQVDKNLNTIKGSLPPKFHPNLEKTRAQVTALNSSLIDANAVIKQKDGELKTQTAAITEINTDIGAISKQINAFDKKILVLESDAKVAEARNVKLTKDVLLKNNEVLKFWEPGAPSFDERIACLKYAYEAGYATSISCEPMLDDKIDLVIDAVRPDVTHSIWI